MEVPTLKKKLTRKIKKTVIEKKTETTVIFFVFVAALAITLFGFSQGLFLDQRMIVVFSTFWAFLLVLLPFFLTILFFRLVIIVHEDESMVDHLTYIDLNTLNRFNQQDEPRSYLEALDRNRDEAVKKSEEFKGETLPEEKSPTVPSQIKPWGMDPWKVSKGLSPSSRKRLPPKYTTMDIVDIPEYDTDGPSPFQ